MRCDLVDAGPERLEGARPGLRLAARRLNGRRGHIPKLAEGEGCLLSKL